MDSFVKKIIIWLIVVATIAVAGYIGYRFYLYAVQDITQKVKTGVSEGAREGISKGVGDTVNPLKWPGKLFGK